MTGRAVVAWCLREKGVTDSYPFGPDSRVFKVGGKMFAACPRGSDPNRVNLKAEPATALRLRRQYRGVQPGYHMNKDHWNTVQLDGSVPDEVIKQMLDESYRLVVASLPAAQRQKLGITSR